MRLVHRRERGAQDVVGLLAAVDDRLHALVDAHALPSKASDGVAHVSGTGVGCRAARSISTMTCSACASSAPDSQWCTAISQRHEVRPIAAVRMKTSISSSKRAGASYSH